MTDGTACMNGSAAGACHDGVCFDVACGNRLIDPGEACDDGNANNGDGCSADCKSTEVCGNGVIDAIHGEQCDNGDSQSHDGCSSTCVTEIPRWQVEPPIPSPRSGAPLAFDTSRHRVVMFGGGAGLGALSDTNEWDGTRWLVADSPASPVPRSLHALVYDGARKQTVLFDGTTGARDTWTWDGNTWTLLTPANVPPARAAAAFAYDATHKQVVLYGGFGDTDTLADTWVWDGTNWTDKTAPGAPMQRYQSVMAYDAKRGVVVMFGGVVGPAGGGGYSNEIWEWDGTAWTQKHPTGAAPVPRGGAAMAYDPKLQAIVMFGGDNGNSANPQGDMWSWNGTAWAPISLSGTVPPASYYVEMATDPYNGSVVMYDADTQGATAGFYEWKNGGWTQLAQPGPGPIVAPPDAQEGQAVAFDPTRGIVVTFGGTGASPYSDSVQQTWIWNGTWHLFTGGQPGSRVEARMVYDRAHDEMVLFGGERITGGNLLYSDTWTFKNNTWIQQVPAHVPPARMEQTMVYDPAHGNVVMFGGQTDHFNGAAMADTWTWDGTDWHRETATGPSARFGAAGGYDPIHQQVVMFGGGDEMSGTMTVDMGDTWIWNGSSWTPATPAVVPPKRHRAGMAWDAARKRLVLVGGTTGIVVSHADSWEWDGQAWQLIPANGSFASYEPAVFEAPEGAGVYAFDAALASSSSLAPTLAWRLQWNAPTRYDRCDQSDGDSDGKIGCADPDCWSVCTPSCPPGTSCPAGAATCGDGTCSSLESCESCPGDCGTCATTCGDFECNGGETAATCPSDC